ncbi:MAG: divalent cation tolerance protein CutA [Candidatus Omnitrophica bacterium]|nr:divalent cation tolerance protein CutA [Candidatus Omnitrophota bacterium]
MDKVSLLYVTASGKEEAREIGKKLVEDRLASCVNIYEGMTAIYRWEGRVESGSEAALIIKSKSSLVEELKKRIKELHSYSCPCILVFEASDADAGYAEWILSETK